MIPIMALWTALLATLTTVKGLSVVPAVDRTEVVVEVDGPVEVSDFALSSPARIVLDIAGARQSLSRSRYDDVKRGGVIGLRLSQYQRDVVRVVVDLERAASYRVEKRDGEIRISLEGAGGDFAAWRSPGAAAEVRSARVDVPAQEAAPAAPVARPAAVTAPAKSAARPNPPITIYFKDTPIIDVLATFAEFSGRSIIPGEGVTASINADIRNQPWDVALEAVLQSYGLAAIEMESGIIRVDKVEKLREREKVEDLLTRSFAIKYASVDSILPAIQGLLSERGKVTKSSSTNMLVVTDGRSVVEQRIAPMVEQLDIRTPQVTIAAKIMFVDRTALEELGIVYDLKDSRGNQLNKAVPGGIDSDGDGIIDTQVDADVVRLRGNSFAALANANARPTSPSLQLLNTLVLGRHSLISFVEALSSLSVTDIQASPVITTLDHREAYVQVGEETPIRVIDAGAAGSAGTPPRSSVQMKNTGIILRVTPHVTGNQVMLDLHAERSNIAAGPSDAGIIFQKQTSETQILLNSGETAVISGMTIVEKGNSRTGIPFLMNLPVVGRLFRTTIERETKKDLLIMVTPHIIREGDA